MTEDGREEFDEALFGSGNRRKGPSPDNVSAEVIEEEMALFRSAASTLGAGI